MKVSVKIDDQIYNVEIQDINKRPIVATVDGETFEITPEVELSASSPSMPAPDIVTKTTTQTNSGKALLAPLPGTVTEIFVLPGAQVEMGQPVCVIEAMKLFNEIESEVSGKIVKVLVDDASPVEFDQPLFLVDPS